MLNFGVGVDVGVSSGRFSLMYLDNSPVVFSAGTASSDGGDGGAIVIGGTTVIGGGLGLPNATRIPPKHVRLLVKFS